METIKTTYETEVEMELGISGVYDAGDASVGDPGGFNDINVESCQLVVSTSKFIRDGDGKLVVEKTSKKIDLTKGLEQKAVWIVLGNLQEALDGDALAEALRDEDIGRAESAADYRYEQMRDDRDD